jgi:hypothetical protein
MEDILMLLLVTLLPGVPISMVSLTSEETETLLLRCSFDISDESVKVRFLVTLGT